MLEHSFIFLPRLGSKKEQQIWKQGITEWNQFLQSKIQGISLLSKAYFDRQIIKAKDALIRQDCEFFHERFSRNEMWRLYTQFRDECAFLDIETSYRYGSITVIGIYNGFETKMMVRGFNLDKELFLKEISKYKLVLTFNGASFDLPVIRRYFGIDLDIPHIDLRHVCSRVGLKGGLKSIERELGIVRDKEVQGVVGSDAVYLWKMFKSTKNRKYLDLLIKYNEEDIINLRQVADVSVNRLWNSIRSRHFKNPE